MIDNKEASKIISQNEIEIANKFKEKDYGAVQSGPMMLFVYGFLYLGVIIAIAVTCFVLSSSNGSFPFSQEMFIAIGTPVLVVGIIIFFILCSGFIVVGPNEAIVFQLFGKYKGTFKKNGWFWANPLLSKRKISLKIQTLQNQVQKVNDLLGNPIEIGAIITWRVVDTAKALFNVENYSTFITTRCDTAIREVARKYPYDTFTGKDEEKTLRASSKEISTQLCVELDKIVFAAGIDIVDIQMHHLAYAHEIAASMLQKQQAVAVVNARKTIVEGAVGMVEMALKDLEKRKICKMDDAQKARIVSNLLVVICSSKDTSPVISTASNNDN